MVTLSRTAVSNYLIYDNNSTFSRGVVFFSSMFGRNVRILMSSQRNLLDLRSQSRADVELMQSHLAPVDLEFQSYLHSL